MERALAVLGSLEARIMREAWTGGVIEPFVVRDMRERMPYNGAPRSAGVTNVRDGDAESCGRLSSGVVS